MKLSAYALAWGPVNSCWPAYIDTDGIMLGVISLPATGCANAALLGNVMSCFASWLWTLLLVNDTAHKPKPPAASSATTKIAPVALMSRSTTLRSMFDPFVWRLRRYRSGHLHLSFCRCHRLPGRAEWPVVCEKAITPSTRDGELHRSVSAAAT